MKVTYAGRHFELTDALKAHIESGLQKLEAHGQKITEVDVVLDVQKLDHIAEININANGNHAHSKEATHDMYASVDAAMAKLEKQLRKSRDRSKDVHGAKRAGVTLEEAGESDRGRAAKTADEAPKDIVIERETVIMKQMQPGEAAREYLREDAPFMPFMNSNTGRMNVLYKREDGVVALIEPAF
jgi:putative sigma-54 modulation protein